jgi:hypothetical protein
MGVMTAEAMVALSAVEDPPPPLLLPLLEEGELGDVPVVLGACEDVDDVNDVGDTLLRTEDSELALLLEGGDCVDEEETEGLCEGY